ncbi:hypothetical protein [Streptomyces sp. NPDC056672]|uniref:hypothetical protein n=1 Tax=Streptomyces sp. NPDC056672 TaxID=3345906 RepID=UPI0036910678
MSKYVSFPEFRVHSAIKEDVNSAIMGLLAGSQMAVHLLKLTEGSNHLLGEVFPQIPHIKRLNLTTEDARTILAAADAHLGAMAIPYILGVHEDYMKACLRLPEKHNSVHLGSANVKSASQHEKLQDSTAAAFDSDALQQFHLVRKMRNCRIHTGSEPNFVVGQGSVSFGHRETVATLAITKNLARQANEILQTAISRFSWGEILMQDLDEVGPGLPKDQHQRLRKVRGYARHFYSALNFSEQEVVTFNAAY